MVCQRILPVRTLAAASRHVAVDGFLLCSTSKRASKERDRFPLLSSGFGLDPGRIFRHLSHHSLRSLLAPALFADTPILAALAQRNPPVTPVARASIPQGFLWLFSGKCHLDRRPLGKEGRAPRIGRFSA